MFKGLLRMLPALFDCMKKKVFRFFMKKIKLLGPLLRRPSRTLSSYLSLAFLPFAKFVHNTTPNRIGHLLFETDTLLRDPGYQHTISRYTILFLAFPEHIANKAFLEIIHPYVKVIYLPSFLYGFIATHSRVTIPSVDYAVCIEKRSPAFAIQSNSLDRPLFELPMQWRERLSNYLLNKTGIKNAVYVCLHVREGGYSPWDEHLHFFRNATINNYLKTVEYLASHNIFTIRMGDHSMTPAPKHSHLIDYATSRDKSDILDLAIASQCFFWIGSSSGAMLLAAIFRRFICCTNMCLPLMFTATGAPNQIGIPKLFLSRQTNLPVSFREIYASGASEFRIPERFETTPYYLLENTPDDIFDIAREAHLRLTGCWVEPDDYAKLHRMLQNLVPEHSLVYGSSQNCGYAFMKKNLALFL